MSATYKPADETVVNELADKLIPVIDGYAGNEIAQAFFLSMFRIGFSIGQDEAPVLIAVPKSAVQTEPENPADKPKKGKNYVN